MARSRGVDRAFGLGGETAFAVLDVETTGFGHRRNDRIVEVGVVQLNAAANIEQRWSTVGMFELAAGDRITLTGDMALPKSKWAQRAETRGLIVAASVAKSNRLLAAADPDSVSGEAKKARQYRIPIVGEAWFGRALEAMGQHR